MEGSRIVLDLVTPQARIFSDEVKMVVVPAMLGDIGVMAFHAPLVSMMRAGLLDVFPNGDDGSKTSYFAAGGYISIGNNKCTIIAETLVPVDELKDQDARKELEALREQFASEENDTVRDALHQQILDAETKLLLAEQQTH